MTVSHLAVEFSLWYERRDGVHHQHINGVRAHQRFRDLECLLAVIGLRNQQVVHVDAQLLGVAGIECVLGIHERGHAASLLRLGNHLQSDGGLTRRLRPENFHHASAGKSADAEGRVK